MRVDGGWYLFDDEVERPVILGEVLARDGNWVRTLFLVDTGADRTVLNADTCAKLGFEASEQRERLGGLGGLTEAIYFETQIRLTNDSKGKVNFRGNYAAVIEETALDLSVLGRDILSLFAVIVDEPQRTVCLLSQRHSYTIVKS
jgi:predicted aspartyl protease